MATGVNLDAVADSVLARRRKYHRTYQRARRANPRLRGRDKARAVTRELELAAGADKRLGLGVARGVGAHGHTCVTPTCRKKWSCAQPCDPRSLKDSICTTCFVKEVAA